MKRIFYLMPVPWGWIKQRPHFIAEYLAHRFIVTVYFDKFDNPEYVKYNSSQKNLKIFSFFTIPSLFKKIIPFYPYANFYIKKIICILKIWKNNIVWVTSPSQFAHIRHFLPSKKIVIYDNMDDIIAMCNFNPKLLALEADLCNRCNLIICSSDNLKTKLIERYNIENRKIEIINNAVYKIPELSTSYIKSEMNEMFDNTFVKLMYVGTISHWFDFDSLLEVLNNCQKLIIYIIGPADSEIINHTRLLYIPPIEHSLVFEIMRNADALIMPFKIDELILGVNPVKAYEYIATGKPVIMVGYPETEKFKDFIYLYYNTQELLVLTKQLENKCLFPLKSIDECRYFALQNTWEARSNKILEKLNELF